MRGLDDPAAEAAFTRGQDDTQIQRVLKMPAGVR